MSKESREQILKTAHKIIFEKGYAETKMDFLAQKAGVVKKTIYNNFSSKHELFEEVMKYDRKLFFSSAEEIMSSNASFADKLIKIFTKLSERLKSIKKIMPDITKPHYRKMDLEQALFFQRSIISMLTTAVEEGIRTEEIKKDLEPGIAAYAIFCMLRGVSFAQLDPSSPYSLENVTYESVKLFLLGVLSSKGVEMFENNTK